MDFFKSISNKIDNFLNKITDNPIVKKLILAVSFLFLLIILIAILASCSKDRVYTYEEFEKKMVDMAKTKYSKSDNLPKTDKDYIDISLQTFVDSGYIKDIQSVIKGNTACTGKVRIVNNNGYYLYIPKLSCGEKYETKDLYNSIVSNKNLTVTGNGLYQVNNEEYEYIFKGDNVNNYISLNGITYLVLRVNNDHTLRVLDLTKRENIKWDDRYNVDKNTYNGINNYIYNNINSRIKDYVEKLYNNEKVFNDKMKAYFATTKICIGKRSQDDNIFDTTIECSNTTENFPFTLISANEFYLATLDTNCQKYNDSSCTNYNYLKNINSTWTITADKDTSYKVWKLNSGINLTNASNSSYAKIVTTLNGELVVKDGDGSSTNPFIIKTFDSKK